jgi:hypothetical protein
MTSTVKPYRARWGAVDPSAVVGLESTPAAVVVTAGARSPGDISRRPEPSRRPLAHDAGEPGRAGQVKGGPAAERSEGTLL